MAAGVGFFRTEGGPEGVDLAEGHGHALALQLAADGEVGGFAEEILGIIDLAVLGQGGLGGIDGGDPEHLAGALAVAAGDEGGMGIDKAAVGEELMDTLRRNGAHPERCAEGIGAGAQVLDGTQEFHGVALFLQGIIGGGGTLYGDLLGVDLKGLLGLGGEQQPAPDDEGGADILSGDLIKIRELILLEYYLQIAEVAAVIQLDEAQRLTGAQGAYPAADGDRLGGVAFGLCKQCFDLYSFHGLSFLFSKVIYNIIVRRTAGCNPFFARCAKKCGFRQLFCKKGVAFAPWIRYNKFSSGPNKTARQRHGDVA